MITQQKQWRVDKSLTLPRATPQSRRLRVQEVLSVVVKGSETRCIIKKKRLREEMNLFKRSMRGEVGRERKRRCFPSRVRIPL